MSIVAIRSTDGFNWQFVGVVANASGARVDFVLALFLFDFPPLLRLLNNTRPGLWECGLCYFDVLR
jgi:hypothetical protein